MDKPLNRERSLRMSLYDGIFCSVHDGFTNYVTPFALVLGAKDFLIGLLSSLPAIAGAFTGLNAANIAEKIGSRLQTIKLFVMLQALLWVIIAFIPYFSGEGRTNAAYLLLLFIILVTMFGNIEGPNWTSLMSEIVEKTKYGRFFGFRGSVTRIVNIISMFGAGMFLALFSKESFTGFLIIFAVAGLCRFISGTFIGLMDDVPMELIPEKKFGYLTFIKRYKVSNFVKFVVFVSALDFSVSVASPFFSVYMLRDLKFSYATYTAVNISAAIISLLTLSFWGRLADRLGNAKVIKIAVFFVPLIPLLWLFSKNVFYILVVNAFAGYIWSGFSLCAINYVLDASTPAVRTRCISYYGLSNNIATFFGAMLGGFLATHLPVIFEFKLMSLFLFSGILRALISLVFINTFKEVRPCEDIHDFKLLFKILGIEPIIGFGHDIFFRTNKD